MREKRSQRPVQESTLGKIENFTGIDSIYETPAQPNITIDTLSEDPDLAVKRIISYLETNQPA